LRIRARWRGNLEEIHSGGIMAEQKEGWFNDPYGRFQQRYFNGKAWTEHVATGGEQQVDPLGASSVIPIATPPTAFVAPIPTTGGRGATVVKFLDATGPDSRERPRPNLRAAVAGLGGAVLAIGVLLVALGDDPSRGQVIAVSLALIAAAWAIRMFVKLAEVQAAAVGMVVVAIPVFATSATVSDGTTGFWTGLLLAALFLAAWAFPSFKSRNLLLGLGALALVAAFGSLTSPDGSDIERCDQYLEEGDFESFDSECQDVYNDGFSEAFFPPPFNNSAGDEGTIYLVGGALYLGLTWWLDRRGLRGTGTAFSAAGLVSTIVGTGMLAGEFGDNWAPIFVLIVGLVVCLVGSHGERRATTWWGAVLTAIATVWFVAVQWEPDSSVAFGGVLLVAGVALVVIPFGAAPLQAALQARRPANAPPGPPPPFTPDA
jgi:hypothetical protein